MYVSSIVWHSYPSVKLQLLELQIKTTTHSTGKTCPRHHQKDTFYMRPILLHKNNVFSQNRLFSHLYGCVCAPWAHSAQCRSFHRRHTWASHLAAWWLQMVWFQDWWAPCSLRQPQIPAPTLPLQPSPLFHLQYCDLGLHHCTIPL